MRGPTYRRSSRGLAPLMLALPLVVAACGTASTEPQSATDTIRSVRVAEARAASGEIGVRAVGVLGPKDELRLGFKIGGVIERVDVDVGDTVRAGDVLAVLDRTEIHAAVERATQAADKAARDLERTRALYADDVATREQLEHSETALNIARADLDAVRFDAQHARIEAPADGLLLRRLAEPGEVVAAGDAVVVVGSLAEGWAVRAAVTDRDVVQLALGDAARVTVDAFPGEVLAARIAQIAAASDGATGTYEVELAIEPDGRRFVEGLVAKVELDGPRRGGGARLWIPVEALLEANGAYATIAVVSDDPHAPQDTDEPNVAFGKVERRRVQIGELSGSNVEVRGGLNAGERVATDGAAWAEDGARVAVLAEMK